MTSPDPRPLTNEFGEPLPAPHYINRDQVEADGWHCTVCGESVDFDGGDPIHDNPHLNPEDVFAALEAPRD